MQKYVGAGSALVLDDHKGILPPMNSGGKCVIYRILYLHFKDKDTFND
jgi:hypothetical protein